MTSQEYEIFSLEETPAEGHSDPAAIQSSQIHRAIRSLDLSREIVARELRDEPRPDRGDTDFVRLGDVIEEIFKELSEEFGPRIPR